MVIWSEFRMVQILHCRIETMTIKNTHPTILKSDFQSKIRNQSTSVNKINFSTMSQRIRLTAKEEKPVKTGRNFILQSGGRAQVSWRNGLWRHYDVTLTHPHFKLVEQFYKTKVLVFFYEIIFNKMHLFSSIHLFFNRINFLILEWEYSNVLHGRSDGYLLYLWRA